MSDENPYQAPETAIKPLRRPTNPVLRPLVEGLVAVVGASILLGVAGFVASLIAVIPWWVSKFRPKARAPGDDSAQAFVDRPEAAPETAFVNSA